VTLTLSWLDSSSASRRQALEVIKLFEEKGTVDEIGIGSVRDAISDVLFPGTSVLHTRARYFLFIPWIYQYLENRRIDSASIAREDRKAELGLIQPLLDSDDSDATIGRLAGVRLKNLPSRLYWSGLGAWGLRLYPGSQDQYHRSLDRLYKRIDSGYRDDDGQPLDGAGVRNWHAGIPAPPPGFPKCPISLRLTRKEAEYLRERLLTQCRGSLLAYLADACKPVDWVSFVWAHPDRASFPERNQNDLMHARNFSEVIHGAPLLYNLMLAEKSKNEELTSDYQAQFQEWGEGLKARADDLAAWGRDDFWRLVHSTNPQIPLPTRVLVDTWLDLTESAETVALRELPRARRLIEDRERAIKGGLARLFSAEALLRWSGAAGVRQLDYRWNPQVQRLVADIQLGLRSNA
jgi:uncharacterized protein DUF6361